MQAIYRTREFKLISSSTMCSTNCGEIFNSGQSGFSTPSMERCRKRGIFKRFKDDCFCCFCCCMLVYKLVFNVAIRCHALVECVVSNLRHKDTGKCDNVDQLATSSNQVSEKFKKFVSPICYLVLLEDSSGLTLYEGIKWSGIPEKRFWPGNRNNLA